MSFRFSLMKLGMFVLLTIFTHLVFAASSEDYINRANDYLKNGELKSAVIELKNALQKDGNNSKARMLLGEAYIKLRDGASAEKELKRAKRLGEKSPSLQIDLGRAYLLQGKADHVLASLDDNKKYSASVRAKILTLKAQAYFLKGNKPQSQKTYEQAIELDAKSINAKLGLARIAMLDHHLDKATGLVKSVVEASPKSDEAWALYGEIARLSGEHKIARERFDKALKLEPGNLTALLGKASASIESKKLDIALSTTGTILKRYPNHPMANYLRGVAQFRKSNINEAEESIQKVLQVAPNHIPSLQIMGAINFSKGKYEQAEQSLRQVMTAVPGNTHAAKILAATYLKTKQPKQAIGLLQRFADKSKDPQLLSLLGSAYMQDRQNDKGLEMLEKALALAPKAVGIQTQLAMAQLMSGEGSKAAEQLESAVELSPELTQADVMLTLVHLRNKEFQKALTAATNMQKKNRSDPLPHNLMGAAYLGLKKRQEARQQFEKALKVDNKFAPAAINLAKMDEQDGKVDRAIKRYKNILKQHPEHAGALMSLARITERQGDEPHALAYMEKAYELNPDNMAPGLFLIKYYLKQENSLKALSIARNLKDRAPKNPQVVKALGTVQAANKEYSSAILTFQSLAKLVPESPEPPFLIGKTYLETDDLKTAKKHFEDSLKLKADYVPAQLALVDLELKTNDTKQALSIARNIQKQYPAQSLGYQVEGDIYARTKSYDKAIVLYKKAMEKSKTPELVIKLSNAYSKVGINKENYELLENWIKENPRDLRATLLLANIYQAANRNKKAIARYSQALELNPKNVIALNNIAWLYQVEKDPKALDYAERAYNLASNNPSVADTYGWLLVNAGKADKGLTILQQAVIQAPHLPEVRYHMAVAMHKAGHSNDARIELERLLNNKVDFPEVKQAQQLLKEIQGG
jgi:putative PEP-CTERM system TPR-repeat lipoprotein